MTSNWLYNNEVKLSMIEVNEQPFIVYIKTVSKLRVVMVEHAKTSKRAFPDHSMNDLKPDDIVRTLAQELLQ